MSDLTITDIGVFMHLTRVEKEVLQSFSDGDNSAEIAESRFRSKETIYAHMKHVREKLEARTIAQAVKIALKHGLINSIFLVLMVSQVAPVVRKDDDPRADDKRRLRVTRTFSVRGGRVREDLM